MSRRVVLLALLSLCWQAQATPVRVGVGEQTRNVLDISEGAFVGELASLYQCPLDKSGLDVEFEILPHARLLLHLQRGTIDIGLPLVRVGTRDRYAVFAKPLAQVPFELYTRHDIDLSGDLSRYSFTAMRATASVDLVARRNARPIEVGSWPQALQLVELGRYDGLVIPAVVAASMGEEKFESLNRFDFGTIPLSFYISQGIARTKFFVDRINAGIAACQSE